MVNISSSLKAIHSFIAQYLNPIYTGSKTQTQMEPLTTMILK